MLAVPAFCAMAGAASAAAIVNIVISLSRVTINPPCVMKRCVLDLLQEECPRVRRIG
jgi:hypothetical protein